MITLVTEEKPKRSKSEPVTRYTPIDQLPVHLTQAETAEVLRLSVRSINRLIEQGRLKGLKLTRGLGGGRVVVTRDELKRFLAEAAND
jgi:excisionase family DNA binding protein